MVLEPHALVFALTLALALDFSLPNAYSSPRTDCVKTSLLMTLQQHESLQSVCGQHVPMLCLEFEQQCIQQSLEDAGPHFRFQIQLTHRCCCRCPTMVSSLAALDCCANHQLMIRSHRQDHRSFCPDPESR